MYFGLSKSEDVNCQDSRRVCQDSRPLNLHEGDTFVRVEFGIRAGCKFTSRSAKFATRCVPVDR